jgi:O-acetyl-ADP-ribose deacetylase (regulator of RNase III)
MVRLEFVTGDLFSSPDALAHCVSRDFRMGAGVALEFRTRFGKVPELLAQTKSVGEVAVLDRDPPLFYLVTKEAYYHKPTLETLRASLASLALECRARGVRRLAIPRLGCGLDRLRWPDVERLIRSTLADDLDLVTVYTRPQDVGQFQ